MMSRIDDVINVAGHRLSTGQMEEVIASHNDVAECAVVGVADQLKGQIPIGFAVLNADVDRPHEDVASELIALVRERVGPVASFKTVAIVDALPKTRSGKTLRATIRKMADGEQYTIPPPSRTPHARRLHRTAAKARIRKRPNPSGITRPTRLHSPRIGPPPHSQRQPSSQNQASRGLGKPHEHNGRTSDPAFEAGPASPPQTRQAPFALSTSDEAWRELIDNYTSAGTRPKPASPKL